MPKQTKQSIRELLADTQEDLRTLNIICTQLTERNNNQSTQLQNMLNIEQTDKDRISVLESALSSAESRLHDSQSAYAFRHNQEMETSRLLHIERSQHRNIKFQFDCLKAEVTRLLVLQQFPGGVQDELMVTRSRNRVRDILTPVPTSEQSVSDNVAERPMTPEELEHTQS